MGPSGLTGRPTRRRTIIAAPHERIEPHLRTVQVGSCADTVRRITSTRCGTRSTRSSKAELSSRPGRGPRLRRERNGLVRYVGR
jgi:hypothetical protein